MTPVRTGLEYTSTLFMGRFRVQVQLHVGNMGNIPYFFPTRVFTQTSKAGYCTLK